MIPTITSPDMSRKLFLAGDRPLLNLALVVATFGTTFWAYFNFWGGTVAESLLFAGALVAILGSHEMGHYLLARKHQVATSLPYFIPLPLGFGTLGAVIRIRSRIPNKDALVDIGAAGPLAGVAVAVPLIILGIFFSPVMPGSLVAGAGADASLIGLGKEIFQLVFGAEGAGDEIVSGRWATQFGDNLLLVGLQYVIKGPLAEGQDLSAHPLLIAGWFGLLVTMLNLLPVGQLDGGHLTFAMFGKRAELIGKVVTGLLVVATLFASASWLLWCIVTAKVIGYRHPEVILPEEPLSRGRRVVCWLCFVVLVLCLMPVPLRQVVVK